MFENPGISGSNVGYRYDVHRVDRLCMATVVLVRTISFNITPEKQLVSVGTVTSAAENSISVITHV
jgi:hypothetical protein